MLFQVHLQLTEHLMGDNFPGKCEQLAWMNPEPCRQHSSGDRPWRTGAVSPPSTGKAKEGASTERLQGRKTEAGALPAPILIRSPSSVLRTCPPTHRVGSILVCPDFCLPKQHALANRMRQVHVCCPRVHVEKTRVC